MRHYAREPVNFVLSVFSGDALRLLSAPRVRIEHGKRQNPILPVEKNEGFPERGKSERMNAGDPRRLADQRFDCIANQQNIRIYLPALSRQRALARAVKKNIPLFIEHLRFTAGRTDIQR